MVDGDIASLQAIHNILRPIWIGALSVATYVLTVVVASRIAAFNVGASIMRVAIVSLLVVSLALAGASAVLAIENTLNPAMWAAVFSGEKAKVLLGKGNGS